ncbi:unnamed protein product, partial [Polarella glacialis]
VPPKGFAFECGGRLITICSCLNYCDAPGGNNATILCVTKEEKSSNLQVRPKVITAQVAKIYTVLGMSSAASAARRWPTQRRAPTPGRLSRIGDGDAVAGVDSTRLVILHDHCVVADPQEPLALFPAFGPGRYPGGAKDRGQGGAFHPPVIGRGLLSSEGLPFYSAVGVGSEDRSGRGSAITGPRGSLGLRRVTAPGGAAAPGAAAQGKAPFSSPALLEEATGGGSTPKNSGSAAAAAFMTDSRTSSKAGTPTGQALRTPPGSLASSVPRPSSTGMAEVLTTGSAAARRGATSPTAEAYRLSSAASTPSMGGASASEGNLTKLSGGAQPARAGLAARQSTSGSTKSEKAGSSGSGVQSRGPSRPPGSTASAVTSPKVAGPVPAAAAATRVAAGVSGSNSRRSSSGELSAVAAANAAVAAGASELLDSGGLLVLRGLTTMTPAEMVAISRMFGQVEEELEINKKKYMVEGVAQDWNSALPEQHICLQMDRLSTGWQIACLIGTALDDETRSRLLGLECPEQRKSFPAMRVPMVLKHPITGHLALYGMNSSTCAVLPKGTPISEDVMDGFELEAKEDPSVAREWRSLLPLVTSERFTVKWTWQPGDLVVWDNRCTMHCATGFDLQNHAREMWRTTLAFDLEEN